VYLFHQENARTINVAVDIINRACKDLKGNAKLTSVLELVVSLGNYMNGGIFSLCLHYAFVQYIASFRSCWFLV